MCDRADEKIRESFGGGMEEVRGRAKTVQKKQKNYPPEARKDVSGREKKRCGVRLERCES